MLRILVRIALALAFLFAVYSWVPLGGRTLAARVHESGSLEEIAHRSLARLGIANELPAKARPPFKGRTGGGERPQKPAERVSDSDRRALDRRLAEELGRTGDER